MILNQRRWQSVSGKHGKGVDGLFEKVSFQTAFEGVESFNLIWLELLLVFLISKIQPNYCDCCPSSNREVSVVNS